MDISTYIDIGNIFIYSEFVSKYLLTSGRAYEWFNYEQERQHCPHRC